MSYLTFQASLLFLVASFGRVAPGRSGQDLATSAGSEGAAPSSLHKAVNGCTEYQETVEWHSQRKKGNRKEAIKCFRIDDAQLLPAILKGTS